MRSLFRTLTIAILGFTLAAGSARASQVVFGNLGSDGSGAFGTANVDILSGEIRAQSFNTGSTSTLLSIDKIRLGLGVLGGGSLSTTISIWSDNGSGLPLSQIATSSSVSLSGGTANAYEFTFSNVNLSQANTYWVAVGAGVRWYENFNETSPTAQNSSGYSYLGASRSLDSGTTWSTPSSRSFSVAVFASEPAPAPIPEPGTWAAAALLIGAAAYVRWRRRAQAA